MSTKISAGGRVGAISSMKMNNGSHVQATINHHYVLECYTKKGKLRWRMEFNNLVTTVGRNKYLDATLKTGLTTPAWYVGLKSTGSIVAGDTMASHAGWTEITGYSNATRPAWTPGAVASGSVDNSASPAVFNINATIDVYGSFMCDNSTKGGTTGILLGGNDYTNHRNAYASDTINVTVIASMTSS